MLPPSLTALHITAPSMAAEHRGDMPPRQEQRRSLVRRCSQRAGWKMPPDTVRATQVTGRELRTKSSAGDEARESRVSVRRGARLGQSAIRK